MIRQVLHIHSFLFSDIGDPVRNLQSDSALTDSASEAIIPDMTSYLRHPAFRYLFPFVIFMLLTELQRFGNDRTIFWIYGIKTSATGLAIWFCFKDKWRAEVQGGFDWLAVLMGLAVLVLWVVPAELYVKHHEVRFNPEVFTTFPEQALAIFVRIFGAALIVPIMEELVWRSFLMRYLIRKDFLSVKLGTYEKISFWGTILVFMLVHRTWEWPLAFVTGVLYGGYLVKRKNLLGCMLAHGVTNFGLAVYILLTGHWYFW